MSLSVQFLRQKGFCRLKTPQYYSNALLTAKNITNEKLFAGSWSQGLSVKTNPYFHMSKFSHYVKIQIYKPASKHNEPKWTKTVLTLHYPTCLRDRCSLWKKTKDNVTRLLDRKDCSHFSYSVRWSLKAWQEPRVKFDRFTWCILTKDPENSL